MKRRTTIAILISMTVVGVLGSKAFAGAALPTVPPHTPPPWVWHHDLSADVPFAGNSFPLAAAPGPGDVLGPIPFADGLVGSPWHIEAELVAGAAGNPAGVLVIRVPGGGWVFPYPALAAGAKFQVAFGLPGPGEIIWAEAPEVGPWTATWTNFTPAAIGVDSSVAEIGNDPQPPAPPLAFGPNDPLPPCDVLLDLIPEEPIPAISDYGLIALLLLTAIAGVIVIRRARRGHATA